MKRVSNNNNRGFSLVELIVVVLIMAIIAVALAPQILKWVDNSRKSNDIQLMGRLLSVGQMAVMTDEAMNALAKANGVVLRVTGDGATLKNGAETANLADDSETLPLYNRFLEYAGLSDLTDLTTQTKDTEILIRVDQDAANVTHSFHYIATPDVEITLDDE